MDTASFYFVFLVVTILVLVVANIFLIIRFYKTNREADEILKGGKMKDWRAIFLSQKKKSDEIEQKIKEILLEIENLKKNCEKTIQKIGIVRFNPFNELGGNQSFVIALLDGKNNGIVISSLFLKEGNRVYAKPIKNGTSDYVLSKEELEAIERAIKHKE